MRTPIELTPGEKRGLIMRKKTCERKGHQVEYISGYPHCTHCYEDPRDKWEKFPCAACIHCYVGISINPECPCKHHTSK